MSQSLQDQVEELLQVRRYDPEIISTLEEYVTEQVNSGIPDADANLALLKLYQFYPDLHNHDVLVKILVLCIASLPATDFICAQYLIPSQFQSAEPVPELISLVQSLEEGRFIEFWTQLELIGDGVITVKGFKSTVRSFMLSVIKRTYVSIKKTALMELLSVDGSELDEIIDEDGLFSTTDDLINFPATADNQPRATKVVEQITFQQIAPTLFRAIP